MCELKNGRYVDTYGDVHWYKNGELHKEDGPAVVHMNGDKEWWLDDVFYSEQEFTHEIAKRKLNKTLGDDLDVRPNNNKKSKI